MIIERLWVANPLRNFNYLVGCGETGEALAIDPLDWRGCLARAQARGWRITQIFNTHEHADHTGGNAELAAATGAAILAPAGIAARIGGVDRKLHDGDLIQVGSSVTFTCLDTPGHTLAHVSLYAAGEAPALFCGDTLFNAGVGNCIRGGDPQRLFETVSDRLLRLPGTTRVYSGHEYFGRNLAFTLDREPGNEAARALLGRCEGMRPEEVPVTTLDEERAINVFLRLTQPAVIQGLRVQHPEWPGQPTPRDVFVALRELRNHW